MALKFAPTVIWLEGWSAQAHIAIANPNSSIFVRYETARIYRF